MPFFYGTMTGAATVAFYGTITSPVSEVAEYDLRFQIGTPVEEAERQAFVTTFHGTDPNNDGVADIGVITSKNNPVSFQPNSITSAFDSIAINLDPGNGSVVVNGLQIAYTPSVNWKGVDTVGYSLLLGTSIVGVGFAYVGVLEGDGTVIGGIDGLPAYNSLSKLEDCFGGGELRKLINDLVEQHNKYVGLQ